MTGSLRVHGGLSESSSETVSGKGREGNREGKGRRVETPHHVVQLVERRVAQRDDALRSESAS